jgi:hypothetical protein
MTKYYRNLEQRSPEWFKVRAWVASWTMMKQLTSSWATLKTCQYKVLAGKHIDDWHLSNDIDFEDTFLEQKIRNGSELSARDSANRGIELEKYAIRHYEVATKNNVMEMWFVKLDSYIGCSPDWLIKLWGKYVWAIEIKSLLGQNYIKLLCDWFMKSEYKPQVINYFICMPWLEWVDCISYHPGASKLIWVFHIERILRSEILPEIEKQSEKVSVYKKTLDFLEGELFYKLNSKRMSHIWEDTLYSAKQAAVFMWVSAQTIRAWCKSWKLQHSKDLSYKIIGSNILKLIHK